MPTENKRSLSAFLQISLYGYYNDAHGEISFAHKGLNNSEGQQFTSENAGSGNMLILGRRTHEVMSAW